MAAFADNKLIFFSYSSLNLVFFKTHLIKNINLWLTRLNLLSPTDYLHASVCSYFVRLSDAVLDVCLLKEVMQESNLFSSYTLIYI